MYLLPEVEFMDDFTGKTMEEALQAMASMINRTEKSKEKFEEGTSQYTLQKNRLKALQIASLLVSGRFTGNDSLDGYTQEDLKNALAPINSLISKSEKAQTKLAEGTWQHTMLDNNLKALHIALPLLTEALSGENITLEQKGNKNQHE